MWNGKEMEKRRGKGGCGVRQLDYEVREGDMKGEGDFQAEKNKGEVGGLVGEKG